MLVAAVEPRLIPTRPSTLAFHTLYQSTMDIKPSSVHGPMKIPDESRGECGVESGEESGGKSIVGEQEE